MNSTRSSTVAQRMLCAGVSIAGVIGMLISAPVWGGAGTGPKSPREQQEDKEIEELLKGRYVQTVAVDMVMVPAIVVDRAKRPVINLTAKDFRLYDNGVEKTIDYFSTDREEPVSIAFLLDVSGSMRMSGSIETAKEAIRFISSSLRPQDEASLVAFADKQVESLTEFSTDRNEMRKYLLAVKAYGQTALNDAVASVTTFVDHSHRGRKAIVLLTDGVDNASQLPLEEAIARSRELEVPIYTLGFTSESLAPRLGRHERGMSEAAEALSWIAAETGGTLFLVRDPDEMKEAAAAILDDLRSQYVLGFTPGGSGKEFHKLTVVASSGRYTVRTRAGYSFPD